MVCLLCVLRPKRNAWKHGVSSEDFNRDVIIVCFYEKWHPHTEPIPKVKLRIDLVWCHLYSPGLNGALEAFRYSPHIYRMFYTMHSSGCRERCTQ